MILIIHNIRKRVKYCMEKLRKEDAQKKRKSKRVWNNMNVSKS